MAFYGAAETARLAEVDKQRLALKANSKKDVQDGLKQALSDIDILIDKLSIIMSAFTPAKGSARNVLAKKAADAIALAATLGSDQFKRSFFKAVGTSEWQGFAKAAHALAQKEGTQYPIVEDHCLLCERVFDESSLTHVKSLLDYVESDAQRTSELALEDVKTEIAGLDGIYSAVFSDGSRVREHVHKLDPDVETLVGSFVNNATKYRFKARAALEQMSSFEDLLDGTEIQNSLAGLRKRVIDDIARLANEDTSFAIAALDLEHETLRHRQVLSQLMPRIKTFVANAKWCEFAEKAKAALHPRHVTNKENELFADLIGESYRTLFKEECSRLGCTMPVELQTSGQKGRTVRNLEMPGGYQPKDILSEGEQKAVALADFLTEVTMNPASAAIVLDDPVTSQDHERKGLIAKRLVDESLRRQVIVFTHDLPFLNQVVVSAELRGVDLVAHWIERDAENQPGQITLNDTPATTKKYDNVSIARDLLSKAKQTTGSTRQDAISKGMSALRRTIEEAVVKKLFKGVVPRWQDRVIVTALRKVEWNSADVDEMVEMYENLSKHIDAHSHSDEALGAPPEPKDLEDQIDKVDKLLSRVKIERVATKPASVATKAKSTN